MMNSIEKQHLIKKEKLHPAFYMQSLLEEAYGLNLLTDAELEKIQMQSIRFLAKRTERYTIGDSTSVKIETAQSIMQSIFYTVGSYLKSLPDADIGIALLKQKPLPELYRQGREMIGMQLDKAKKLLSTIQDNRIITNNIAYNDTIEALPSFFSAYDADFAAHDIPCSIDYPLSNDKMDLVGIEYIYNYLQKLDLENQFCQNFSAYELQCLLRGYNEHYQDLLINIFEIALTNLIGSLLAGADTPRLNIAPSDRQYLQQKLVPLSIAELATVLQEAAAQVCSELKISDPLLQKHIALAVMNLPARLKNNIENNRIETMFVSCQENNRQPAIQYEDGRKMDDDIFRSIADEIRGCRYVSDKIAIIQRDIHSLTDLVDILEGTCIFDDEFAKVFQSLGDMELALLLKKLPKDIDADHYCTENEKDWQSRITSFLAEMDLSRKDRIQQLIKTINLN